MTRTLAGAVFDCVVFVQALANRKGPAFGCMRLVTEGRVPLYLRPAVLAEVSEVLSRPKLRQRLRRLTPEAVEAFLRDVVSRAVSVPEVPEQFT